MRRAVARVLAAAALSVVVAAATTAAVGAQNVASTDTPITDTQLHSYQQPTIAVDPGNAAHLAVSFQDGLQTPPCYLAQSFDAGATWAVETVMGPGGKLAIPSGAFAYDTCRNQLIVFGPSGIMYYVVQVSSSTHYNFSEVVVTTTTDHGATFTAPVVVSTSDTTDSTDIGTFQPSAAVDPTNGELYVTWLHYRQFAGYTYVEVSSSTDNGKTFTNRQQLSTIDPNQLQQTGSTVVGVDATGEVYVAWLDALNWRNFKGGEFGSNPCPAYPAGCPPFSLLMRSSTDHGVTFSAQRTVDPAITSGQNDPWRFSHLVSLAVGPAAGELSMDWTEPINGLNRIEFTHSTDAGTTWSTPLPVSPPPGLGADEQDRALVSVSSNGRIDVAYYDLTPADSSGNRLQNTYEASSTDSGVSFATPLKLTSAPSSTNVGPPNPGTDLARVSWFGRNFGLASSGDTAYAAWTDSRRGTVDNTKQDVFFASVAPAPAATSPQAAPAPAAIASQAATTAQPGFPNTGSSSGPARFPAVALVLVVAASVGAVAAGRRRRR
ncbi:MAG: sialidase family protein [Candidatus Dormibacteria bacterium]